jgi:uncharacterized protein
MRQYITKILFFIVIVLFFWGLWLYFSPVRFEKDSLYIQSGTRLWPVAIEIAKTPDQLKKGLMFRHKVRENTGMLFVYSEPQVVRMWMKNTLVPLDMLFIDERGVIVTIAQNARPRSLETISSDQPVIAVLELTGGITKLHKIAVGDTVIYALFDPTGFHKK